MTIFPIAKLSDISGLTAVMSTKLDLAVQGYKSRYGNEPDHVYVFYQQTWIEKRKDDEIVFKETSLWFAPLPDNNPIDEELAKQYE